MADRQLRGILDTSVLIDLDAIDPDLLPVESAISALSMAELAAGPHASRDATERARRQDRLQRAEVVFDPVPFDAEAARDMAWCTPRWLRRAARREGPGRSICSSPRRRSLNGMPLYTRNAADFRFLDGLVDVIEV